MAIKKWVAKMRKNSRTSKGPYAREGTAQGAKGVGGHAGSRPHEGEPVVADDALWNRVRDVSGAGAEEN
jgi:hypothetical protein